MFYQLSDKIVSSMKKLRGQSKITESNVEDVIKEIITLIAYKYKKSFSLI